MYVMKYIAVNGIQCFMLYEIHTSSTLCLCSVQIHIHVYINDVYSNTLCTLFILSHSHSRYVHPSLCTGGTLTMAPDPTKNGALSPVEGAVTNYMTHMTELNNDNMPEVIVHEYKPFFDSSDLGPSEWAVLASDIYDNYYHFDGFVVLMGTGKYLQK